MTTDDVLDCLIIGAGPAGLTASLYLARYGRRFLTVDDGSSRAAWIPTSHNVPFFADGIGGTEILSRERQHLARYGATPFSGRVEALSRHAGLFHASIDGSQGSHAVRAETVLLATGAVDVEPELPNLPDAIKRGLVRYCPICDGYEARGRRIGVIGHGDQGLGEAVFMARSYAQDVTLLTLGQGMALSAAQHDRLRQYGVAAIEAPITGLDVRDGRICALRGDGGAEHRFETIYSALGTINRSRLATDIGAAADEQDALIVDAHGCTSVPGLYAAGDVVRGLNQIVVGMGQAAIAATAIHNLLA